MSRKFVAAVLAVSTAIAGFSAAPARAASQEDIARLLAGAATVFIIGKAIENARNDDRKDKKKKAINRHYSNPKVIEHRPIPKVIPRNPHRYDRFAALPRNCVRRIEGGSVRRVVMGRCLQRNYHSARELPRACLMKVATRRGTRPAYSLPCLRQRGYTLARN
ncbi:hypothetical protein ACG74X_02080 [Marivita sp. S0852]|uniref:hypothetical protein n=1 Tax=Marivita sp. S0852 TaxID=3373893 RepID=UPI003981D761